MYACNVCMYVCMYVRTCVRTYVCMYVRAYVTSTVTMTEALTSVTGRTITRPITSVAGSRIDDVRIWRRWRGWRRGRRRSDYNDESALLFARLPTRLLWSSRKETKTAAAAHSLQNNRSVADSRSRVVIAAVAPTIRPTN